MAVEKASNLPGEGSKVITFRGFFVDSEGNLRRGVRTTVIGEDGEDENTYREHNTRRSFPASSSKTPSDKDASSARE